MPLRTFMVVWSLAFGAPAMASAQAGDTHGQQERARYGAALREAIQAQWLRPPTLPDDAACRVRIRQLPGGDVVSAEVMPDCAFDEVGQRSLERAVLRAQPLPYLGFERVFERDLIVRFVATGD